MTSAMSWPSNACSIDVTDLRSNVAPSVCSSRASAWQYRGALIESVSYAAPAATPLGRSLGASSR